MTDIPEGFRPEGEVTKPTGLEIPPGFTPENDSPPVGFSEDAAMNAVPRIPESGADAAVRSALQGMPIIGGAVYSTPEQEAYEKEHPNWSMAGKLAAGIMGAGGPAKMMGSATGVDKFLPYVAGQMGVGGVMSGLDDAARHGWNLYSNLGASARGAAGSFIGSALGKFISPAYNTEYAKSSKLMKGLLKEQDKAAEQAQKLARELGGTTTQARVDQLASAGKSLGQRAHEELKEGAMGGVAENSAKLLDLLAKSIEKRVGQAGKTKSVNAAILGYLLGHGAGHPYIGTAVMAALPKLLRTEFAKKAAVKYGTNQLAGPNTKAALSALGQYLPGEAVNQFPSLGDINAP